MVVEVRLVALRELVAVERDLRRVLDLLARDRHLQVVRADRDPAERNKREMSSDQPFLDGAEDGLVGLDVDVDVFQLSDLVSVAIDELRAAPFGDVAVGNHDFSFQEPLLELA